MKYFDLLAGFGLMIAVGVCASSGDWRGVAIFGNVMIWHGLKSIHYVLWEIHDNTKKP